MKNKWSNYALKDGKIKSSYIREYCNRKKSRKAGKTSGSDCVQQSGKEQEEVKLIYKPPSHYKCNVDPTILNDKWVVNLRQTEGPVGVSQEWIDNLKTKKLYQKEEEEQNGKSKTRVRSPIQGSGEERSKIGSSKSRSSCRRRRDEEIRKREDGKNGPSGEEKVEDV